METTYGEMSEEKEIAMKVFERPEIVEKYANKRREWSDLYPSEYWILSHVQLLSIHSMLDFGCAAGGFRRLFQYADYTGVDHSQAMLEKARALHSASTFLETLPIAGQYDLVMSLGTLHIVDDWAAKIRHMWKLTGKYLVFDLRLSHQNEFGTYENMPYRVIDYGRALQIINELQPATLTLHGYTHPANAEGLGEVFMGVFLLEKKQ